MQTSRLPAEKQDAIRPAVSYPLSDDSCDGHNYTAERSLQAVLRSRLGPHTHASLPYDCPITCIIFNQRCCDRDMCAMWGEAVTCMLQIRIARFCRATTAEKQQKHSSGLILSDY